MPPPLDPLSHTALIFPSTPFNSISCALTSLTRSNLTLSNRIHSITHDAEFVGQIAELYQLPLIANERCGSWYLHSSQKGGSAYFKSTDGHHGQWGFSLRRLNLGVFEVLGEGRGGCIIVDSTRRGKSMPDALSKTVPIWVTVLNRLLFPEDLASHVLQTPEDVVSRSEHAQIEQRLPSFVAELRGLDLDVDILRAKLQGKPMEVEWVTPDTGLLSAQDCCSSRNSIVLCTASGRTLSGRPETFDYVQGAADDSEAWACGLTPPLFWAHIEQLSKASEDELPTIIEGLVRTGEANTAVRKPVLIKPTSNIWIGDNAAAQRLLGDFDIVVSCSQQPDVVLARRLKGKYFHLCCTTGKVGSRELRVALPKLLSLIESLDSDMRVLITCHTGGDLSVGTALALICLCCGDDGRLRSPRSSPPSLNKTLIKHRLSWIMVSMPDAAPSRATLQSANAFLFG